MASLVKPTLICYLYDLAENTALRRNAPSLERMDNGAVRRAPIRRFDLRMMLSAVAGDVQDEHLLLGHAIVTLLRNATVPEELTPKFARGLDAEVQIRMEEDEKGPRPFHIWNSLGVSPRPSVLFEMTVPVDVEIQANIPLVLTRTLRVFDFEGTKLDESYEVGGTVRDQMGQPVPDVSLALAATGGEIAVTGPDGRYTLRSNTTGSMSVRVMQADRQLTQVDLTIPSDSYDIVIPLKGDPNA
jgi:hypothetical protein